MVGDTTAPLLSNIIFTIAGAVTVTTTAKLHYCYYKKNTSGDWGTTKDKMRQTVLGG